MTLLKDTLVRRWKMLDESWRFAITAFLIIRMFYALWSGLILITQPVAVQNIEISGEPVLTIFSLQDSQAYVYLRKINGEILTFRAADRNSVTDEQTGSIWNISTGNADRGYYQGSMLLPSNTVASEIFPYHSAKRYPVDWLALWQRFDANFYTSISEAGYGSNQGDIHFPPLFSLVIHLLKPRFGSSFLAGLVVSHLAALYAIKLLYDLYTEWVNDRIAKRSILFILMYPTSFFFFSAYTESLFLVTALLSLQYARKRSWAWAGFWTFCAILTRLQGVALVLPVIYLMWMDRPFLRKSSHWFGLALPAFAALFYLFLRSLYVGNNFVPVVEADLHARLGSPWEAYWYAMQTLFSGHSTLIDALNWAVTTLFIVLLITGWRKIPLEYNLYSLFGLLLLLIRIVETQPLNSMLRYSLTLFPSFFILGLAGENPWIRRMILYAFIPLNLYLSAQFFLWGWVA